MWTRKCSQCIALLHWDCKRGETAWNVKETTAETKHFSPPANVKSSLKKSKDCDGKRKRNFCFFSGTWRFKNQKLLLDGVLTLSQKMLSAGFEEKKSKWFSKWKEHVIPKEKNPTEVENTHSVTVIPRLYYLSALTSLSEKAACFIQGILQ